MGQTVRHCNDNGFTLVEAMIAVLILAVSTLVATQGLIAVNHSVEKNRTRQEAIRLGQELLAGARNQSYVALAVGNTNSTRSRQIASYDQTFTVNRAVNVTVPGVSKTVVYTITWDNGQHSYVVRTVVSDR